LHYQSLQKQATLNQTIATETPSRWRTAGRLSLLQNRNLIDNRRGGPSETE